MLDPQLSAEWAYAVKPNIAYPIVGASASAVAALAQARVDDELADKGITVTVPSTAINVVKQ